MQTGKQESVRLAVKTGASGLYVNKKGEQRTLVFSKGKRDGGIVERKIRRETLYSPTIMARKTA